MGVIVGVDQSLTGTGLSFLWESGVHEMTTIETKPGQIEPRLLHILKRVDVEIGEAAGHNERPAMILMEGLSAGSFGATTSILELAGLHYLLRAHFFTRGISVVIATPSQLKKFACGSGAAKKEHVLKAVYKWGIDTDDNNQADAAVLSHIGAVLQGWSEPKNKAQEEVIAALLGEPKKKSRKRKVVE